MNKKFNLELFLSILAIILTILNFSYTVYRDNYDNKELLTFFRGSISNDKQVLIKETPDDNSNSSAKVPLYYEVLICNNSKVKTSILDYSVSLFNNDKDAIPEIVDKRNPLNDILESSNFDEGIFDENGKELSLPISINPGEYLRVKLKLNLLLSNKVLCTIKNKYTLNNSIDYTELSAYLDENSIDIYGNTIISQYYEGNNLLVIRNKGDGEYPIYKIDFNTTRNNHFTTLVVSVK